MRLMIDLDFDVYVWLLDKELLSVLVYSWIGSLNSICLDRINLFAMMIRLCYLVLYDVKEVLDQSCPIFIGIVLDQKLVRCLSSTSGGIVYSVSNSKT